MKKFGSLCLLLCFLVSNCFHVLAAQTDENSENVQVQVEESIIVNSCHGINAQSAMLGIGQLVENIQAAFLYEANSDTLMYAQNADAQMYPASLVKIMTALIAVENGDLEDVVTVTESAVKSVPYDAVSAELAVDEQLTLNDLLHCLLVDSANDAAAVIAEYISGSQTAFIEKMNDRAQQLGCTGTQFTNVHGLHDDAQYTTARDVARILEAALDNEAFYTFFTAVEYIVAATNKSDARELSTGNFMMDAGSRQYYDPRVIGGRTGVTNDGRRCFAAASEQNGMRLISVVMGAESVFQEDGYTAVSIGGFKETSALLDEGFDGYKTAQILYADQALRQCPVTDGNSNVVVGPQVSLSAVLPGDITMSDLTFQYSDNGFRAPIEAGQKLSSVQIWYGGLCVAQADLYAMNSVENINSLHNTDTEQNDGDRWPIVLTIVLTVLGCAFAVLLLLRFSSKLKMIFVSARSKRYRRSRRRSR